MISTAGPGNEFGYVRQPLPTCDLHESAWRSSASIQPAVDLERHPGAKVSPRPEPRPDEPEALRFTLLEAGAAETGSAAVSNLASFAARVARLERIVALLKAINGVRMGDELDRLLARLRADHLSD